MLFIHNQNIVHLNITPYNIIFKNKVRRKYLDIIHNNLTILSLQDFNDELKIIDFAHSTQLSSEQEAIKLPRLQGTLEYLSPEVLNCENVGKPADIWSVGVITYMLVTGGVSPFYAGSRLKTMKR